MSEPGVAPGFEFRSECKRTVIDLDKRANAWWV